MKTVAIRLKAINDDFKKSMSESGDSTKRFATASTVALAAVGAAAVGFAKKAADAYVDYGKQIGKLSRISGESSETSSRMAFAAQQSGVSTESLANGIKFLQKNMAAGNPEFAKLGVNVKDAGGNMRSTHAVLLDTADAIGKMSGGAEKTSAILKIFGRSGLEMGKLLNQGSAGIRALEAEAEKYGLVLTGDNMAAVQQAVAAQRDLDAAMMGLKIRVGQEVLPAFTKLTEVLASLPGPVMSLGPPLVAGAGALGLLAGGAMKVHAGYKALEGKIPQIGSAIGASAVAIGGAIAVYEIWNARMQQSYAMAAQLGDVVSKANQSHTYGQMGAQIGEISTQIRGLSEEIQGSVAPWDADKRADMDAMRTELEKQQTKLRLERDIIDDVAGATGKSTEEVKAWMNAESAAGRTYANSGAALAALTGRIDQSTLSTEEYTTAVEAANAATQTKNQEDAAVFSTQFAYIAAQRGLADAQDELAHASDGVAEAEKRSADAQKAVATAQTALEAGRRRVTEAEQQAATAADNVTDAVNRQRDAQRALNDLLAGPTQNEQIGVESARIALEEARRRAAGITTTDPALEARKNALDVLRAEIALKDAEGAHDRNVAAAQAAVTAADKAVVDAQTAKATADQGVIDAQAAVGELAVKVDEAQAAAWGALNDYLVAVEDARVKAEDATIKVAKANIELEAAANNIQTAFATGATSMDLNRQALDRWVAAGRLTRDEADLLMAKLGELDQAAPKGPAPSIPGRPGAGPPSAADEANPNLGNWWGGSYGLARGGYLSEGWNLVGEQGPEAVLKRGGRVLVSTAAATAGMVAAPAKPGAGYTHNGDIIIGQATERTARDIAWEQRRLALSMASR